MPESTGAPQPSPSPGHHARVAVRVEVLAVSRRPGRRGQVGGGQHPFSSSRVRVRLEAVLWPRSRRPGVLGPGGVVQPGQGPAGDWRWRN